MIKQCVELQDELNTQISPDWRSLRYDWQRYICVELAELMDHVGYKHWKKATGDLYQQQLEVVDIFHFLLSDMLVSSSIDSVVRDINVLKDVQVEPLEKADLLFRLDELISTSATKQFGRSDFTELYKLLGMELDDVCKMYLGKNTLNKFRANNGYKEGTYKKIWKGREDNKVLEEILNEKLDNYTDAVYARLEKEYKAK